MSTKMKFSKTLMVGLLSLGTIAASALPSMARPGYIYSEANVRSAPSFNSRRVDGLPEGTPLEVLRVVAGRGDGRTWYYVRSTGQLRTEGWVSANLVKFESTRRMYGTLVGNDGDVINIRSDSDIDSRVKHTGIAGDLVEIETSIMSRSTQQSKSGYIWYKVVYPNGASGWVRGDLIGVWPDSP
jgi:uncharacterized protein YgiM (DUF1202 family)